MTSSRSLRFGAVAALLMATPVWSSEPSRASFEALQRSTSWIIPDASYDVQGTPDWLAVGEDSVWVSSMQTDTVAKMDPASNRVTATIGVKKPCSGMAIGAGSLWVPSCGSKTIDRIDIIGNKLLAQIPVTSANPEGGIAFAGGAVWVPSDPKGLISRIDPATNKVVAQVKVAPGSYTAVYGYGLIWVTSTEKSLVTVIHPQTNQVITEIPVDANPRFLTAGEGYIWTLNQARGTVSKIDPQSRKVVATIQAGLPGTGGDIAAGEGAVWVTMRGVPLTRIDPATNEITGRFSGQGGDAIRTGLGFVWLSNGKLSSVWRMTPQKITRAIPHSWMEDALKVDLNGDGVPDAVLEDVTLFIPGEPLTIRMKRLGPVVERQYMLQIVAGRSKRQFNVPFVESGGEWSATITQTEPGWIHYSVCDALKTHCTPRLVVASPNTSNAYATHKLRLVEDGFLSPPTPAVRDYSWHILEPQILDSDYLAVSRQNGRKTPMTMVPDEDYGELKRHLWEFQENTAYGWGLMTPDEKEEVACVYIQPSSKKGYDAMVIFWVTQEAAKTRLEPELDRVVRDWVSHKWPFRKVAYPGRDIPSDKWEALPNAE